MSKRYDLDRIDKLFGRIIFNHDEIDEDGNVVYYIIRVVFFGHAVNGGAKKDGVAGINDGSPSTVKFTGKQIYQRLKQIMPLSVANLLKELYLDLIDDDISEE
ncbi:MAG: hypothetical protein GY853_13870 [PVC group bacterium]|nr:hypothetical protein [PVC group bacterium]